MAAGAAHAGAHERVLRLLDDGGVRYRLHTHKPVQTIAEAHARVPHLTRNLLKTVVFRTSDGQWVLVAVGANRRIAYKKLANALGLRRTDLRSVAPREIEEALGFQVGGVGPFPIADGMIIVMDQALAAAGRVLCGSGINTVTVELEIADLIRVAGALLAPITQDEAS